MFKHVFLVIYHYFKILNFLRKKKIRKFLDATTFVPDVRKYLKNYLDVHLAYGNNFIYSKCRWNSYKLFEWKKYPSTRKITFKQKIFEILPKNFRKWNTITENHWFQNWRIHFFYKKWRIASAVGLSSHVYVSTLHRTEEC